MQVPDAAAWRQPAVASPAEMQALSASPEVQHAPPTASEPAEDVLNQHRHHLLLMEVQSLGGCPIEAVKGNGAQLLLECSHLTYTIEQSVLPCGVTQPVAALT